MKEERLRNAILFFASNDAVTNLGRTKLAKLLYYADAWVQRETLGESVTRSEYIKYAYGPVPSKMEKVLKRMRKAGQVETDTVHWGGGTITAVRAMTEPDLSAFTSDEVRALEATATKYGRMTAGELSALSHDEPSWVYAETLQKLDPALVLYGAEEDPDGL